MEKEILWKTYRSQWTSEKDGCKIRPEAAIRSDILYLFAQGNLIFIRKKSGNSTSFPESHLAAPWMRDPGKEVAGNFEKWCLWQPWLAAFSSTIDARRASRLGVNMSVYIVCTINSTDRRYEFNNPVLFYPSPLFFTRPCLVLLWMTLWRHKPSDSLHLSYRGFYLLLPSPCCNTKAPQQKVFSGKKIKTQPDHGAKDCDP